MLAILGIVFPFLWLIGAVLPAKRGSQFELEKDLRRQVVMDKATW